MADYTPFGLNMVTLLAPQIRAASEYYAISPLAIAGAIAQEQLNQSVHWDRALMWELSADAYLNSRYATGVGYGILSDPLHTNTVAKQTASDLIFSRYKDTDNLETTGKDWRKKLSNPILVDYGPGGVKFAHVITNVLSNPDAPGLAPYVNDFYTLGVNLKNGSDPQLADMFGRVNKSSLV